MNTRKFKKVSISTVRANFKKGILFDGFIIGNNVVSWHFFNGWYLAHAMKCENIEDFETAKNGMEFYLDAELGNAAAIYIFVK
jgi:hypothetical protein